VVFCVSQAPDVEAKIVEELRSLDLLATHARPAPRAIEWEDTSKLVYLNNVIKVPYCFEGRGCSIGRPPAPFAVAGLHALLVRVQEQEERMGVGMARAATCEPGLDAQGRHWQRCHLLPSRGAPARRWVSFSDPEQRRPW
jgi:hypothetical protein